MSITIYPSQFNMREDGGYEQLPAIKGDTGAQGVPGVGALPGGTKGQVPVKQSGTDYDVAWEDIDWKLVWTNASPTSSFASQDVLIDLSAYSEVRVDVYSDTNASHLANSSGPCKVGVGGYAIYFYQQSSASTQHYQRQFFTYTNKVHFNDCRSRNTSSSSGSLGTSNNACIPCRIYAR